MEKTEKRAELLLKIVREKREKSARKGTLTEKNEIQVELI
ncbi:hypothetical protein JOC76_001336 [Neobacillus cucumis]|nr:hypothetical protein [Neobacillus cucumis]